MSGKRTPRAVCAMAWRVLARATLALATLLALGAMAARAQPAQEAVLSPAERYDAAQVAAVGLRQWSLAVEGVLNFAMPGDDFAGRGGDAGGLGYAFSAMRRVRPTLALGARYSTWRGENVKETAPPPSRPVECAFVINIPDECDRSDRENKIKVSSRTLILLADLLVNIDGQALDSLQAGLGYVRYRVSPSLQFEPRDPILRIHDEVGGPALLMGFTHHGQWYHGPDANVGYRYGVSYEITRLPARQGHYPNASVLQLHAGLEWHWPNRPDAAPRKAMDLPILR